MDDVPDELEALVAGMRGQFLDTAADRVAIIAREAAVLGISADATSSLTVLVREAHTLKGGGATFGVPSLGDAGGRVEQIGKALLARSPSASSLEPLLEAVAELQAVLAGLRQA